MTTLWCVLHTKPQKEEFLWDQLSIRRIEAFPRASWHRRLIHGSEKITSFSRLPVSSCGSRSD